MRTTTKNDAARIEEIDRKASDFRSYGHSVPAIKGRHMIASTRPGFHRHPSVHTDIYGRPLSTSEVTA